MNRVPIFLEKVKSADPDEVGDLLEIVLGCDDAACVLNLLPDDLLNDVLWILDTYFERMHCSDLPQSLGDVVRGRLKIRDVFAMVGVDRLQVGPF